MDILKVIADNQDIIAANGVGAATVWAMTKIHIAYILKSIRDFKEDITARVVRLESLHMSNDNDQSNT